MGGDAPDVTHCVHFCTPAITSTKRVSTRCSLFSISSSVLETYFASLTLGPSDQNIGFLQQPQQRCWSQIRERQPQSARLPTNSRAFSLVRDMKASRSRTIQRAARNSSGRLALESFEKIEKLIAVDERVGSKWHRLRLMEIDNEIVGQSRECRLARDGRWRRSPTLSHCPHRFSWVMTTAP